MGNQTSKKSREKSDKRYKKALNSYETACKEDTEMQSFDTCMQARTNKVINKLATDAEVRLLSFESLQDVTGCLLEINQEVVKVLLSCNEDIWMHNQLLELVKEYLDTSSNTIGFCTFLKKGLEQAKSCHAMIISALKHFENESFRQGANGYEKTLEELKNFKDAESPFNEDFFEMFQSVNRHHMLMLEKLQAHKKKLDKKLRRIPTWRKISGAIFVATLASILICSVVAAAMAAPPLAAGVAAATSVPVASMGKWIDSMWKKYEDIVKGQKDVVRAMQAFVAIKDMENMRELTKQLEIEIKGMVNSAELPVDYDKVRIWGDEIKKKCEIFVKKVENMEKHADLCITQIDKATHVVLKKLIKTGL